MSLQYAPHGHGSAEMLDNILLMVGLVGELIYCSMGIILWLSRTGDPDGFLEIYVLIVYSVRLLQVVVQAVFIVTAKRFVFVHVCNWVFRITGEQSLPPPPPRFGKFCVNLFSTLGTTSKNLVTWFLIFGPDPVAPALWPKCTNSVFIAFLLINFGKTVVSTANQFVTFTKQRPLSSRVWKQSFCLLERKFDFSTPI